VPSTAADAVAAVVGDEAPGGRVRVLAVDPAGVRLVHPAT
jgi:hypothetical protein